MYKYNLKSHRVQHYQRHYQQTLGVKMASVRLKWLRQPIKSETWVEATFLYLWLWFLSALWRLFVGWQEGFAPVIPKTFRSTGRESRKYSRIFCVMAAKRPSLSSCALSYSARSTPTQMFHSDLNSSTTMGNASIWKVGGPDKNVYSEATSGWAAAVDEVWGRLMSVCLPFTRYSCIPYMPGLTFIGPPSRCMEIGQLPWIKSSYRPYTV